MFDRFAWQAEAGFSRGAFSAQIQNHLRHCESQWRRLPSRTLVRMLPMTYARR